MYEDISNNIFSLWSEESAQYFGIKIGSGQITNTNAWLTNTHVTSVIACTPLIKCLFSEQIKKLQLHITDINYNGAINCEVGQYHTIYSMTNIFNNNCT